MSLLPAWLTAAANRADAEQPPQPAACNPAVVAAAAEAKSAVEWLEAVTIYCDHGTLLQDRYEVRGKCGRGCKP